MSYGERKHHWSLMGMVDGMGKSYWYFGFDTTLETANFSQQDCSKIELKGFFYVKVDDADFVFNFCYPWWCRIFSFDSFKSWWKFSALSIWFKAFSGVFCFRPTWGYVRSFLGNFLGRLIWQTINLIFFNRRISIKHIFDFS